MFVLMMAFNINSFVKYLRRDKSEETTYNEGTLRVVLGRRRVRDVPVLDGLLDALLDFHLRVLGYCLMGHGVEVVAKTHRVGYDKAHCEPSDWVKTNQWVCALTL